MPEQTAGIEKELFASFRDLEETHSLFELRVDDELVWPHVRDDIFQEILTEEISIERNEPAQEDPYRKYTRAVMQSLKYGLVKSPFFSDASELLFWGRGRRTCREDGTWRDVYCDPIINKLDRSYTYLEYSTECNYSGTPETEAIRFVDPIVNAGEMYWKLRCINDLSPSSEELRNASRAFESEFGYKDVEQTVLGYAYKRKVWRPLMERLLDAVDPDAAVFVSLNPARTTLLECCSERDIPTVELQHGVIGHKHIRLRETGHPVHKRTAPDYLLTWGEYWNGLFEYVVPDDRVVAVGYPNMDIEKRSYDQSNDDSRQILFVSQRMIGEALSKFAARFRRECPDQFEVVYKLHPNEYRAWQETYPWLNASDVQVVDDDTRHLYELFSEASAQVGVSSAALYEGLNFDLPTFLVNLPTVHRMSSVLEKDHAILIESVEELVEVTPEIEDMRTSKTINDGNPFFEHDALREVTAKMENVLDRA